MTATLLSQSASVLMVAQMMAMFDNYDDIVDDDNAMFENDDEHSFFRVRVRLKIVHDHTTHHHPH